MSEIGKGLRRGAKALLDFSTQQRLLEREKAQKLADSRDAENRAAVLKLAEMNTPAGLAATRSILGDTFDPAQELEYRRLSTLLKAPNVKDQYDVLNPALASAGFKGKFAPTDYDVARTQTTQERTKTEKLRQERQKQIIENDARLRAATMTKLGLDIESSRATLANKIAEMNDDVYSGKSKPGKITDDLKVFDSVIKEFRFQLEDMKSANTHIEDDPENPGKEHAVLRPTPEYIKKKAEVEKDLERATATRKRLLDEMFSLSEGAQQLDRASGGQIAGNVGDRVKSQMAMELIRRNYPELYKQLIAEQARQAQATIPNIDVSGFVQQKNGAQRGIGPEALSQTPDGKIWIFKDGKFNIVK